MIVATAGHVDHGKSTLVRALTGVDPDRWEAEKQRGLTIDLGFAYQEIDDGVALGFVDVPGHIRFINNMLAGVSAVDLGLLVVAADDGVMPQTREHVAILDLLGIHQVLVAITKIDRVEASRVALVEAEVKDMLGNTDIVVLGVHAVSGETGEGVTELGETLQLLAIDCPARAASGGFRLAIDRCFSLKGAGLVVTGSVFAGAISVGDEVVVQPHGLVARVRSLHRQDKTAETGQAGDRCAINLAGPNLSKDQIRRGNWLVGNFAGTRPGTKRIDIRLHVLRSEAVALKHWTPVHVHTGANHVTARVATLQDRSLPPGSDGLVQLVLDETINVCAGDRVVVRDQSGQRTLGGGVVLDPYAPARGRAKAARIDSLLAIDPADFDESLSRLLTLNPGGVNLDQLFASFNLTAAVAARVPAAPGVVVLKTAAGAIGLSAQHWEQLQSTVSQTLAKAHSDAPHVAGLSVTDLWHVCQRPVARLLFDAVVARLVDEGTIARTSGDLHLPEHDASLSKSETALWSKVEKILQTAALPPPVSADLARELDLPVKEMEKRLARLVHMRKLVRPAKNRYFLAESMQDLEERMRDLAADRSDGFEAAEFRDATGLGRNLAIEVLEYFDRTGLTRRQGDRRVVQQRGPVR